MSLLSFTLARIFSVHPETPDETLSVSNSETRDFRPGKEIEGLRGDVDRYVAQASPIIDAARAEKDRFLMETI